MSYKRHGVAAAHNWPRSEATRSTIEISPFRAVKLILLIDDSTRVNCVQCNIEAIDRILILSYFSMIFGYRR